MDWRVIAAFAYLICIAIAFLLADRAARFSGRMGIASIAAVVRFVPVVLFPWGAEFDIVSYRIVGEVVLAGRDVYSAPEVFPPGGALGRYPYLPGWSLFVAAVASVAPNDPELFTILVKIPGVLADVAICLVLHRAAGAGAALAHALSPISVAVSAYHGQFDALPILAALLSMTLRRPSLAGFALGAGIWLKSWPALFLVTLVGRFGFVHGALAILIAAVTAGLLAALCGLVSGASLINGLPLILSYQAVPHWGLIFNIVLGTGQFEEVYQQRRWRLLLGCIVVGGYALFVLRDHPRRAALAMMLLFFIATPSASIQHLSWVGPVALLANERRMFQIWTIATLPFLVYGYFSVFYAQLLPLHLQLFPLLSLMSWLVCVVWLAKLALRPVTPNSTEHSSHPVLMGPR